MNYERYHPLAVYCALLMANYPKLCRTMSMGVIGCKPTYEYCWEWVKAIKPDVHLQLWGGVWTKFGYEVDVLEPINVYPTLTGMSSH
ncbi:MAG: hypothetical protein P8X74_16430 [Reinekea sp.]